MAVRFLGPDPIEDELARAIDRVAKGAAPASIERRLIDFKEEPGRRGPDGTVYPGRPESEPSATYLAEEAACFANTAGGGAIIVGIANDGARIGTELDAEWLRHRIYELTQRRLTVTVREGRVEGTRILVLLVPEALEPIKFRDRLRWRVGDHCVEVDTASWWSGRLMRLGRDWSAEPSNHPLEDVRPAALEIARTYLRLSQESHGEELAELRVDDLMRRINAVTGDGFLTNAAALLFVGRGDSPALDYMRRDQPGGDSRFRHREPHLSVLEELAAVEQAVNSNNPVLHLPTGLVVGQIRALPPLSIREAIVNGLAHRDWAPDAPTIVEHIGTTLVVTSPGGFIGGVTADNIITHPSAPRHRALAELLSKLRIAEREGIGVDRMVRDMLRLGYPRPAIEEISGPVVRTALVGDAPDVDWMRFLGQLRPDAAAMDLDVLLLLDHLVTHGWVDAARASEVLQKSVLEGEHALSRLDGVHLEHDEPLVSQVNGTLPPTPRRLSNRVRKRLSERLVNWLPPQARSRLILDWARHRGRVSTTEIADVIGTSVTFAGELLKGVEEQGLLAPGRQNRPGRGFFYVPVEPGQSLLAADSSGRASSFEM